MSDQKGTVSSRIDFSRVAEDYEATRGIPKPFMKEIIEDVIQTCELTPTSLVLELGCGAGRFLRALASRRIPVVGLDLSEGMLKKACSNQQSTKFLRSNLISGDAIAIPMNQGAFKAIIAIHLYHLMSDWKDALSETMYVLGSGGTIITGFVGSRTHQSYLNRLYRKRREELGYSTASLGADPTEVIGELQSRGANVNTHRYQTTVGVPLKETITYLERRVFSSMWRDLPEVVHRQIMQDVRIAATTQFKDPNDVEQLQIDAQLHFVTFE